MLPTMHFLIFMFWFMFFIFLSNVNNFFKLIIFSEIMWIFLYSINVFMSSWSNDFNLLSLTLFVIGFAAIEMSIGLMLMLYYNTINKSLFFKNVNNKVNDKVFF